MNDETLDWEKYIFPLKYSHNTAIHASTLHSPYYITYNTTPRMPWRPLAPNENVNQTAGEIFTRMSKHKNWYVKTMKKQGKNIPNITTKKPGTIFQIFETNPSKVLSRENVPATHSKKYFVVVYPSPYPF